MERWLDDIEGDIAGDASTHLALWAFDTAVLERKEKSEAASVARLERSAFAQDVTVDLPSERQHLDGLAGQRIGDRKELAKFREHMQAFEARAARQGLGDQEMAKAYKQVARLIEVDGDQFLSKKSRIAVAEQAMRMAADPTLVDSGYHKTCNVTAVESRGYTRYPSDVLRLVADVATAGTYTLGDGTVITPPPQSLKPDDEAGGNMPRNGERSYASHIFQVTAVNVFWQTQTRDPAGNPVGKGAMRYEQQSTRFKPDTGERLMNYSSGRAVEARDRKGNVIRQPHMRTNDVVEVSNLITGRQEADVLLENASKPDIGRFTSTVASEKDLKDTLVRMKQAGRLPVILTVHTGNEPFAGDSRLSVSSGGVWHVLTVTDIDPVTGKVGVDNQWGSNNDHFGKKAVDVGTLFKATLPPGFKNQNQMLPRDPNERVIIGER